MQYQSECFEALKSVSKVSKPFEKVLMDTLKLFMAIPGKVNFLQMGRYGEFSEQTYRNNFENEAFDWFAFNEYLVRKVLNGKFLAIAVDPSFLPKSGKKTPWIGRFWSGVAGEMKRGQEIFGVGVIDVENHDCMTLSAPQTPDAKSLEEMDYNLVEWYCQNLIILKGKTPEDITPGSCRRILLKRDVRQPSAQGRLPRDKQVPQRCGSVLSDPSEANRKERSSEVV